MKKQIMSGVEVAALARVLAALRQIRAMSVELGCGVTLLRSMQVAHEIGGIAAEALGSGEWLVAELGLVADTSGVDPGQLVFAQIDTETSGAVGEGNMPEEGFPTPKKTFQKANLNAARVNSGKAVTGRKKR